MRAEILISDTNEHSCLIQVRYNVVSFESWSSYTNPLGPNNSGDCSRWRSNLLRLTDG